MINRLVAENTFKMPPRSQLTFSLSKKLIAFQNDTAIKVRTTHREAKDIDVPIAQPPLQFELSQARPWLLLLTPANLLEIYSLQYISGINQGTHKKIAILHNVEHFSENKWGLVLETTSKTLKVLSLKEIEEKTEINLNIDCNTLKALADLSLPHTIVTDISCDRILVQKHSDNSQGSKETVTEIIDRLNNDEKHQKTATISYLSTVLALYRQKFVFQRKGEKEVEIIDIDESKVMGKFATEANIRQCELKQNLLVIITNKDNTDFLHFFVLNAEPSSMKPLITNRVTYQKGKGDLYRLYNLPTVEAVQYLDKKKGLQISDLQLQNIEETSSSLLYILNKTKQKIEMIKLDHSKLMKSPFGEQKLDHILYSKKSTSLEHPHKQEESVEVQRSRIHSSIAIKAGESCMEQAQKHFVQKLIDIKLKKVMVKFNELEQRVVKLQKMISGINSKIDQNLQQINRKEIKEKVEHLFENLTPQFQKYFAEIFKQVSGVFEQGVTYYNLKLAKEAEFHKEALTQIVTDTFKFTEEVAEISKKEQSISQKTEEHLKKILDTKKKWNRASEEFEAKTKEVGSPVVRLSGSPAGGQGGEGPKPEGKVFVRADLNYPTGKRQT